MIHAEDHISFMNKSVRIPTKENFLMQIVPVGSETTSLNGCRTTRSSSLYTFLDCELNSKFKIVNNEYELVHFNLNFELIVAKE